MHEVSQRSPSRAIEHDNLFTVVFSSCKTRWGQLSASMPRGWIEIDGVARPIALALATVHR
jgi:hypothetical protein